MNRSRSGSVATSAAASKRRSTTWSARASGSSASLIVVSGRAPESPGEFERSRAVGTVGLERLEHFFFAETELVRDLLRARRARQLLRQRPDRLADREHAFLELARHPNRPRGVAEVAAQFAENGRRRERAERRTVLRIEPLDRLQEADHRDLHEVVVGDSPVAVPVREVVRDPEMTLDELIAKRSVAGAPVLEEVRVDRADRRRLPEPRRSCNLTRQLVHLEADSAVRRS